MTDITELRNKQKIAKEQKDLYTLAECSLEMANMLNVDYCRQEAAYFLGRLQDLEGFSKLLNSARSRSLNIDERHRSYDVEHRLFNIGWHYPDLDESDLDFLEDMYSTSSSYAMTDRMLFDKERLPRELLHFDPNAFNIKNESFTDEFLDNIFNAAWKNEFELNIQEAIDNRYTSQTQNEVWGFDYDPRDEPIFVYNRRTNQIEVDRSLLSDIMLFPIHNLGSIGDLVEGYKEFFGDDIKRFIVEDVLPKIRLSYGWETAVFCCYWYRIINSEVIKKLGIESNDYRLKQIRRNQARIWLLKINNKPLR